MQDEKIIELYFSRDENAITETAAKYGRYCTQIAFNILKDIFDSEECVNDTYHKVWQSIPPTRPRIFSAFLGKITRNLAIDRYKSKTAQKRGGYSLEESLDELSECVGESGFNDLDLNELGALISNFLKKEKDIYRKIFVRRYFYEDSISDISKGFGISVSYVKTALSRSRKRLAEYLKKEGIFI